MDELITHGCADAFYIGKKSNISGQIINWKGIHR
jgi:hypothetical protein